MEKAPKRAEPVVYTEEEAERLIDAAKQEGGDAPVLVLLLLHGGLRASEARALRWGDIDLRKGSMKIQHNYSDGEEATPKGGVAAPVGMSPELSAPLRALPRGHKDDHVLTRVVREGPLKHDHLQIEQTAGGAWAGEVGTASTPPRLPDDRCSVWSATPRPRKPRPCAEGCSAHFGRVRWS